MKVFCVFQRFREDNEDFDSYTFDDNKGADLLKIFDTEEKAKSKSESVTIYKLQEIAKISSERVVKKIKTESPKKKK